MKELQGKVTEQINSSINISRSMIECCAAKIFCAAEAVTDVLRNGGKILLCGNGGSAADAQHISAEFINRFQMERSALPAVALTTDTSVLTSIANDYNYSRIFSRQVYALGAEGDALIAISTSGASASVIEAARAAKERGVYIIALTGRGGGELKEEADLSIIVPSAETPRIQEAHILIAHIICDITEQALFTE